MAVPQGFHKLSRAARSAACGGRLAVPARPVQPAASKGLLAEALSLAGLERRTGR